MSEVLVKAANTSTAARPQALCDIDGCGEPATHSYVWAWGQAGYACSRHVALIQQQASNLKRQVTLTCLQPGAASQITRDERTKLIASKLAAEGETEDVKARNLDLYNANRALSQEIVRQEVALRELQSQADDLREELEQVTKEKMSALRDLASSEHERARLDGIIHAQSVGADPPGLAPRSAAHPPPPKKGG